VLVARVVGTDVFGNLALDAGHRDLDRTELKIGASFAVRSSGRRAVGTYALTFADVKPGGLLLHVDASGSLALAVNGGDAAKLLGLRRGDEVRVEPA
jgi:S-adenosylmethionine hydrolase